MLIVTITLGTVLVGMGAASYVGARQAADTLDRARSVDLVFSVRQALMAEQGADRQEVAEDLVEQLGGQGLRFLAVVTHKQGLVASAGEPVSPLDVEALKAHQPGERIEIGRTGDRILVVAAVRRRPLPARAAVGQGRAVQDFLDASTKLLKALKRGSELGERREGQRLGSGGVLVLEYEPVISRMILSRAVATLIIALVVATVLIGAAVVFWRLSLRAEAMAEQLARDRQLKALGEMSAVLGHELRNPLAALKGHAQLLVERLKDHPGHRGAETVVREAVRMEQLTEQILEFARTGAIEAEPQDPAEVARSAADGSGLAGIELDVAEGLPPWPMDRARIEQVLVNLLKNAVQASPEDGVVELKVAAEAGGLVFEVRDHGEGLKLSPGEEEWIFEPFHTKRVRGTGLGLAVSKRIVEAHGGRISAQDHPEGGAVFTVWLPRPPAGRPEENKR
jgi:two-component system sensor histidine kinase HydH